jgi:hypothetical protein
MSDYTEGRLELQSAEPGTATFKRTFWQIGVRNGKGLAFVFGDDAANARRFVACWNALEGISTEQIESGGFKLVAA